MELNLKSNRKFMLYISLPASIFFTVILLFLLIGQAFGLLTIIENPGDLGILIMCIMFDFIGILATLLILFHKGSSYVFAEDIIKTYEKGILFQEIKLSEVEYMHYYPFRFHYLLSIFGGALSEGGAMKVHVKAYNGNTCEIGFIGEKDAYRLKELYPDKFTIYYERKKHK